VTIALESLPVTEVVVEIPGGHRQVTPQRGGQPPTQTMKKPRHCANSPGHERKGAPLTHNVPTRAPRGAAR